MTILEIASYDDAEKIDAYVNDKTKITIKFEGNHMLSARFDGKLWYVINPKTNLYYFPMTTKELKNFCQKCLYWVFNHKTV